jgi:hypothetical protein
MVEFDVANSTPNLIWQLLTSADAAGLPIFPGLARADEAIGAGEIKHALRFTVEEMPHIDWRRALEAIN